MIDTKKLSEVLKEVLSKETKHSLLDWLKSQKYDESKQRFRRSFRNDKKC